MKVSYKQIENAVRVAKAQTFLGDSDTTANLIRRLYESRDTVHTQQKELEFVDTNSKCLIANFLMYS